MKVTYKINVTVTLPDKGDAKPMRGDELQTWVQHKVDSKFQYKDKKKK